MTTRTGSVSAAFPFDPGGMDALWSLCLIRADCLVGAVFEAVEVSRLVRLRLGSALWLLFEAGALLLPLALLPPLAPPRPRPRPRPRPLDPEPRVELEVVVGREVLSESVRFLSAGDSFHGKCRYSVCREATHSVLSVAGAGSNH